MSQKQIKKMKREIKRAVKSVAKDNYSAFKAEINNLRFKDRIRIACHIIMRNWK